jgi:uncharacterized protein (TIGR01244 family)
MKNQALIDGITVAGQPTDEEIKHLHEQGFATLINVRLPDELDEPEEPKAKDAGLTYLEAGFVGGTLRPDHVKRIRQVVDASTGPVVIHCHGGTRAAVIAAIIAAEKAGLSAEYALRKIDDADFDVLASPYEDFIHQYFHIAEKGKAPHA